MIVHPKPVGYLAFYSGSLANPMIFKRLTNKLVKLQFRDFTTQGRVRGLRDDLQKARAVIHLLLP